MLKVAKILESSGSCPFQLVALTECNRKIYLRYRGGRLRFGFIKENQLTPDEYLFSEQIGHQLDGCADDALFRKALAGVIEFPENFTFDSASEIHELENREGQGSHWKHCLDVAH